MIEAMISDLSLSQVGLLGIGLYLLYLVVHRYFSYSYFSPYILIQGPKRMSFFTGNYSDFLENEKPGINLPALRRKFGKVFRYPTQFGHERLFISDPAALNHVLVTHGYWYYKTPEVRHELGLVLGKGILWTEGDDHRRQKRLLAPAFSQATVDQMVPLFYKEAKKMNQLWLDEMEATSDGKLKMDISDWFGRLTLDVIGLAGFGYRFGSLEGADNKLAKAFNILLKTQKAPDARAQAVVWLVNKYKLTEYIPAKPVFDVKRCAREMREESLKIIDAKEAGQKDEYEKNLITLLMKANSAADSKSKMTKEEVMSQISTFMVAGSETSSTGLTWAIHFMTLHQDKQKRLRDAIRAALKGGQETLTATVLNNIDYLDAFLKETLRLQPPVPMTVREAQQDDVLPLATPLKLTNGQEISEIPISKGTVIQIPMGQLAFDESVWGEDVNEFKPERWLKPLPQSVVEATGAFTAWSHQLTFIGGSRACIGYRFSIAEMKATLAVIARDLQFDLEPGVEIVSRFMIVARPYLAGQLGKGSKLPVIVSRAA